MFDLRIVRILLRLRRELKGRLDLELGTTEQGQEEDLRRQRDFS